MEKTAPESHFFSNKEKSISNSPSIKYTNIVKNQNGWRNRGVFSKIVCIFANGEFQGDIWHDTD